MSGERRPWNVFCKFPRVLREHAIDPRHLVHVGAHEGQEMPWYGDAAVRQVTLVEPIPELAEQLRTKFPAAAVVECACAATAGVMPLYVMDPTNVSTLQAPGPRDRVTRVIDVPVRPLAEVAPDANIAVIDAQGKELDVMAGAAWDALDLVIVEACTVPDPTLAALYDDVIAFADSVGFAEVGCWSRDLGFIDRFARGEAPEGVVIPAGEVRDVILVRRPS